MKKRMPLIKKKHKEMHTPKEWIKIYRKKLLTMDNTGTRVIITIFLIFLGCIFLSGLITADLKNAAEVEKNTEINKQVLESFCEGKGLKLQSYTGYIGRDAIPENSTFKCFDEKSKEITEYIWIIPKCTTE